MWPCWTRFFWESNNVALGKRIKAYSRSYVDTRALQSVSSFGAEVYEDLQTG